MKVCICSGKSYQVNSELQVALAMSEWAVHYLRVPISTSLTLNLKPRKASNKLDLPSDCPPIATISGIGSVSPKATAAACRRLHDTNNPSSITLSPEMMLLKRTFQSYSWTLTHPLCVSSLALRIDCMSWWAAALLENFPLCYRFCREVRFTCKPHI